MGDVFLGNSIKIKNCKIYSLRESLDSLTNEVITHLNKINRLLTEIESEIYPTIMLKQNTTHNQTIILGD